MRGARRIRPYSFGTIPDRLLADARRLRWLHAPQAAPPAGHYTLALIAHPVVVTNFREIYNDHIGAHIMTFAVRVRPRVPSLLPLPTAPRVAQGAARHRFRPPAAATALIVGVGGIGAEVTRLAAAFGMRVMAVDARRKAAPPGVIKLDGPEALDSLLPQAFVILTVPHTPATEGLMHRARFRG